MIWLTGDQGMLGKEIVLELRRRNMPFISTGREVDITDIYALRAFVSKKGIRWIINAAAYTAVDKAESDEHNANKVNAVGPACIGRLANEIDAKVIHISTDYVFDGKKTTPYVETDEVKPISVYGRTKLDGEIALQESTQKFFIFRISWLYGRYGENFVSTMLRLFKEREKLGIVADQYGSPTWTRKLAENIACLLSDEGNAYDIYHYSDEGYISWYDFACAILDYAAAAGLITKDVQLTPISTDDYPTPAKRPANSAFDKSKVKERLGFSIQPWRENLKNYIESIY